MILISSKGHVWCLFFQHLLVAYYYKPFIITGGTKSQQIKYPSFFKSKIQTLIFLNENKMRGITLTDFKTYYI